MCISLDHPNEWDYNYKPPAALVERSRMDIKKGRRKSFDIEYVIVTEDNLSEVAEWSGGIKSGEGKDAFIRLTDKGAINQVQTKAFIGDVVVHHMELNTYKKFGRKAFNKSYEETTEHVIGRDSSTGQYISQATAAANPETTTVEHVELPRDADPS